MLSVGRASLQNRDRNTCYLHDQYEKQYSNAHDGSKHEDHHNSGSHHRRSSRCRCRRRFDRSRINFRAEAAGVVVVVPRLLAVMKRKQLHLNPTVELLCSYCSC